MLCALLTISRSRRGYCPLTTSPDPSGVAVCVGAVVGVDVAVAGGVCVDDGVCVGASDGVCVAVSVGVWGGAGAGAGVAVGTTVAVGGGVGDAVGVDVAAAPLRGSRAATVVMAMRASAMSPDAPYARRR